MRITIVPVDETVTINGIGFAGIDMSSIPSNIHAMQWYDTYGEVEYKDDAEGKKPENKLIEDLSPFQTVIDAWEVRRAGAK